MKIGNEITVISPLGKPQKIRPTQWIEGEITGRLAPPPFDQESINKEKKNHARVTPEGQRLGASTARLADIGADIAKAEDGECDGRCKTCAFRAGTVPNGCPVTQCDATKAMLEGERAFFCHEKKGGVLPVCKGWVQARLAMNKRGMPDIKIDYPYSHEQETE